MCSFSVGVGERIGGVVVVPVRVVYIIYMLARASFFGLDLHSNGT